MRFVHDFLDFRHSHWGEEEWNFFANKVCRAGFTSVFCFLTLLFFGAVWWKSLLITALVMTLWRLAYGRRFIELLSNIGFTIAVLVWLQLTPVMRLIEIIDRMIG